MIEAEHSFEVGAGLDRVWDYVVDVRNWAELMPGLQDFDVIDADNSRWTLKIGVGGMVRTVRVTVHVDEWDGPQRARFSFKLEGDPVQGGGTYTAEPLGVGRTAIALAIQVAGSGPMAPMWEALGRPVLPTFVKAFAGQLRERIEQFAAPAASTSPADPGSFKPAAAKKSLLARIAAWLRSWFR